VEQRLFTFERRCEQTVTSLEERSTRSDLELLMKKLVDKPDYSAVD
jgi:hypothetical protein